MPVLTARRATTRHRGRPDKAVTVDETTGGPSVLSGVAATTSHHDRDELDRALVRLLLNHLNADSVTLLRLVDDGDVKRVLRKVIGTRKEGVRPFPSFETGEPLLLADVPVWQECVTGNRVIKSAASGGRCVTHFPIPGEHAVLGILAVDTATPLRRRATALVRDVLQIIKNQLILLDYGELDTLTGLLNRKTFESHFEKLRQRLSRYTPSAAMEPSWVALVDIDHFKSINDRYGHLFGDEVLLLTSRLMQHTFRGSDQLFRFGGEEFVIVLEQATEAGARIAFERLRSTMEAYVFPQVVRVTVSIGFTRVGPSDLPTTCVERADGALYFAKNHGRNGVRYYEELLSAGELTGKVENGDVELF